MVLVIWGLVWGNRELQSDGSATIESFLDRLDVFDVVRDNSEQMDMVLEPSGNDFMTKSCPIFFPEKK